MTVVPQEVQMLTVQAFSDKEDIACWVNAANVTRMILVIRKQQHCNHTNINIYQYQTATMTTLLTQLKQHQRSTKICKEWNLCTLPFLSPSQQCQRTKGEKTTIKEYTKYAKIHKNKPHLTSSTFYNSSLTLFYFNRSSNFL